MEMWIKSKHIKDLSITDAVVKGSTQSHLNVPLLAHGIDNTALDGSPAGPTDGHTHLVVAG